MGLFEKFRTKKVDADTASREEKLMANEGIPFTTQILDDKKTGEKLSYIYNKVKCVIIGDVRGLPEGAILYARTDGLLVNVLKERVAMIENKKICQMVNDLSNEKSKLSSVRVKHVSVEEGNLYCNIGFWTDSGLGEDDEDSEEREE